MSTTATATNTAVLVHTALRLRDLALCEGAELALRVGEEGLDGDLRADLREELAIAGAHARGLDRFIELLLNSDLTGILAALIESSSERGLGDSDEAVRAELLWQMLSDFGAYVEEHWSVADLAIAVTEEDFLGDAYP